MPARVLAVWFDAAETTLVEEMMGAGEMPTLAALRARGAWGHLHGGRYAVGEAVYGQVIAGQPPEHTGAWKVARFDSQRYMHTGHQDLTYSGMAPFFAVGNSARVAVFDVSQVTLRPDVEGIQLLAWGRTHRVYHCAPSRLSCLTRFWRALVSIPREQTPTMPS